MKRKEVGSRVLFCCKRDLGYKSTIFYAAACVAKVDAVHVRRSLTNGACRRRLMELVPLPI